MATKKAKLGTTATKILNRMDYAGCRQRTFGGLKSEAVDGTSIILPTTDMYNFDKFYCVDSGDTYMFYKGTWYKQG